MNRRSKAAVAAIVIITISSLAAVFIFTKDRSLTQIQRAGVIRIGYAVEAPYAFLKSDGEVTGESPEIAKRIVARLGIRRIEWRQVDFASLIAELETSRIDLIAAGMFITAERALRVSFSDPTIQVTRGLLVSRGNPHRLHSYQHAASLAGIRIAVLSGSVEEQLLKRMGISNGRLITVPDALTGRVAVESGIADTLALSSPTIRWMALRDQLGRTEAAVLSGQSEPPGREYRGFAAFAFRKGDRQLLSAWNAALRNFIGSPEHKRLIAEFGFAETELPGIFAASEAFSR